MGEELVINMPSIIYAVLTLKKGGQLWIKNIWILLFEH
jgi:hypothetical protein